MGTILPVSCLAGNQSDFSHVVMRFAIESSGAVEEGVFFGLGRFGVGFHSVASGDVDVGRVSHHLFESAFLLVFGEVPGLCLVAGGFGVVAVAGGLALFFESSFFFVSTGGILEAFPVLFDGCRVCARCKVLWGGC
jgi:hypothetical protein